MCDVLFDYQWIWLRKLDAMKNLDFCTQMLFLSIIVCTPLEREKQ